MITSNLRKYVTIEKFLYISLKAFLFFLPWQTILILKEQYINGFKWQYGTLGFYGSEIILWIAVVLFMVWYWKKRVSKFSIFNFQFSKDRIFLLFCLLFLCYVLASTLWALDREVALQQSLYIIEGFLLFIIIFTGPFEKFNLMKWFVYGSIIPSLLGIAQFLFQTTWKTKWLGLVSHQAFEMGASVIESDTIGRWLRAYGTFGHPNVFGGYLVLVIVILILIMSFIKTKLKESETKISDQGSVTMMESQMVIDHRSPIIGLLEKIFLFIIFTLNITALFFTFSRSAWIAFGIVILLYCYTAFTYHVSRITYHLVFTLALVMLLTMIYFPLVQTRFSNQSVLEVRSTEERVSGYGEAFQLFKQHPWIGVGAGNYTVALLAQKPDMSGWQLQPVHNVFALFVVECGVVGVVLLLGIVASFITYHVAHNTYQRDNKNAVCYALCVMCYVFLSLFDHYLLSSYVGILLILAFFALILGLSPSSPLFIHLSDDLEKK